MPLSDQAAVRAIAARYLPASTALERVPSSNNLVVRLGQAGGSDKILKLARLGDTSMALTREPEVMAVMRQNGMPVPTVEIEDLAGKLVGRPFFIMTSAGDRTAAELNGLSGHNRRQLFTDVGRTLAKIHNIPFTAPADFTGHRLVKPRFERSPLEAWHRGQIAYARQHKLFDGGLLDAVEADLPGVPGPRGFGMCHGDFNPSQCVRVGPAVNAVVDWEAAYVGDPTFDYALFDVVLETAAPPALAEACRAAYAARRPLPAGYEEAYRPFKLAHAIALAGTYHAKRRGGPLRTTQALAQRLARRAKAAA